MAKAARSKSRRRESGTPPIATNQNSRSVLLPRNPSEAARLEAAGWTWTKEYGGGYVRPAAACAPDARILDPSPFYEAFGKRVRAIRLAADMTQGQLGRAVGAARTSITNLEGGKQHTSLHTVFEIASALGVQPTDLLPPAELGLPYREVGTKRTRTLAGCGARPCERR
jgi:DNA-binding XRE family transcriptional regulator